jgi:putative transposase
LSTQLAWMKKNVVACLSRDERVELVERTNDELSLSAQSQLLGLNRTSLYYQPVPPSEEEIALKHRIDKLYIRLRQGWLYLVAILDWYSRYVLSWELDQTMQVAFVLEAMQQALALARPVICNSDQGSQFTSTPYLDLLKEHDVRISMDGRGRALDNIFTERLWRTIKYEEVYLKDYRSPREARHSLAEYLRFYNERRIHQALEYRTPAELYFK